MTEEDFENADKPEFSQNPIGEEANNDIDNLFEGDIILDEINGSSNYLNDVITNETLKWPKVGDTVTIPYTFPSDATTEDKADIAHVINEFRRKTCIRSVMTSLYYVQNDSAVLFLG